MAGRFTGGQKGRQVRRKTLVEIGESENGLLKCRKAKMAAEMSESENGLLKWRKAKMVF